MGNKAIFLDRDNTIIEDPGYISDPDAVKLLPGVELAIKSLAQAGYKIVVVTNQSGVARGLITEDALEKIHAELRRQLAEHGAHLDGIYYCPFHPEGTVEEYAKESELRKPQPGMLLKAAEQLNIDLAESWMIGDGPRDIEAGQRAGCRTIRVRVPGQQQSQAAGEDEDVQADFTVRNLVDAARVIMRQSNQAVAAAAVAQTPPIKTEPKPAPVTVASAAAAPTESAETSQPAGEDDMDDTQVRKEILRYVRQVARVSEIEEFSFIKLLAGIFQTFAFLGLGLALWKLVSDSNAAAQVWATIAVVLQLMALTFFTMQRNK